MLNLPVFVGIDYHQNMIQVCVMDQQRKILANQAVDNKPQAVHRVVAPFGSNVHVAIEACTGAADFAEQLTAKYNRTVELAHPGYVARMKQTPDKSDWTDAKLLADLTRAGYIPRVWLAPKNIRDLRDIVRYRRGLVDQRKQAKLRIRALMRNHRIVNPCNPWTKAWSYWLFSDSNPASDNAKWILKQHFDQVEHLSQLIIESEKRIQSLVEHDTVVATLMNQPGIGLVTAATLRAIIGHFDRFRTGKQLAHFCAVCPRNDSTGGKTTTGGLIKAGDELLRQVLIESAHRLMRYDPHWRAMAERLRAKGKKTCVIVAAVANRWIRRLFYQMVDSALVGGATVDFSRHGQESTIVTKTPSGGVRRSSRSTRRSST